MNTGTYYLYEYKQNQRIRTVGFLKLMRTQMHTQLQLHARIHPLSQRNTLKLYPFHVEGSSIIPGRCGRGASVFRNNILLPVFLGSSVSHCVRALANGWDFSLFSLNKCFCRLNPMILCLTPAIS